MNRRHFMLALSGSLIAAGPSTEVFSANHYHIKDFVILYIYRDEIYHENSDSKGLAKIKTENIDGRTSRINIIRFDGKNACFRDCQLL